MKYDPIIQKIDNLFGSSAFGHLFLYKLLNLVLPRSWHIRRELNIWKKTHIGHQCVLDAGSALGQNAYLISRINNRWSVKGFDINKRLVAHGNKVFRKLRLDNVVFRSGDLTKEMLAASSFDLALAIDIAEFVRDDKALLTNIYQSIRPGGALFLYTHLIGNQNTKGPKSQPLVDEQVRLGYSAESIKEMLKSIGFKRVKARVVFGVLGNLSWRLSIIIPMHLLNVNFAFVALLPVYYALLLPVIVLLNYLESHTGHLTGTAMLTKAYKD
ncbi:MAG: class I SAM-dependent methyltransferase [Bacteroidetes bacterium]|jgi:SAM-dependent methyltransferase|nr:class I SAM-dependent methyltransferase [Bacteroidota bacterium]